MSMKQNIVNRWLTLPNAVSFIFAFAVTVAYLTGCGQPTETLQVNQPPNQISSVNPAAWVDVNSWSDWQNLQVLTVTKDLSPITAGCIVLGIIGTILLILGRTAIGIALLGGALAGVGLVMGVSVLAAHPWTHWFIGGTMIILGLLGAAYLVFELYEKIRKTRLADLQTKTIIPELVKTVEVIKPVLTPDDRSKLFGFPGTADKGVAGSIQSPVTQATVKEVRYNDNV